MVKPTEILNFPPPLHPLRQLQLVCVCVQLYADTLISAAWMTTHSALASFNKHTLFIFWKNKQTFYRISGKDKAAGSLNGIPRCPDNATGRAVFCWDIPIYFRTSK